ncbi:MAG: hypothetical protein AB7V50_03830, partial [Vampirovibrionia bacterium]
MSKTIYIYTIYHEEYMSATRGIFQFEEPVNIGDVVATEHGLCSVIQKIIYPVEHSGASELVV